MKKLLFFFGLFFALPAKAICPVCTIAVGAGIGLSRWLGIDDTITGGWIGALFVSVSLWSIKWVTDKSWRFRGYKLAIFLLYALFIIVPLFWMDIFFHPFNKLWGMDKLILGMSLGMLSFAGSVKLHFFLRDKNGGKVYFPFQKVAFAVGILLTLSGGFYWITK
jgi:hypothetical protein